MPCPSAFSQGHAWCCCMSCCRNSVALAESRGRGSCYCPFKDAFEREPPSDCSPALKTASPLPQRGLLYGLSLVRKEGGTWSKGPSLGVYTLSGAVCSAGLRPS